MEMNNNETMHPEDMDMNALLESMDNNETEDDPAVSGETDTLPAELLAELGIDSTDTLVPAEDSASDEIKESTVGEDTEQEHIPDEYAPSRPKRAYRKRKTEAAEDVSAEKSMETEAACSPEAEPEGDSQDTASDTPSVSGEDLAPSHTAPDSPVTMENPEDTIPHSGSSVTRDTLAGADRQDVPSESVPAFQPLSSKAPAASLKPAPQAPLKRKAAELPILTLNRDDVETEASREEVIWHEIHNAYRTRKLMAGKLSGIEQLDNGKTIAIADYKGMRIIIPIKEMMISLGRTPSGQEYAEFMQRQNKILGNMLGAEIDFVVKGIDSKTRSVVASRREAMLRKRQTFYLDADASGTPRIDAGRMAQARVIAVAEKVIRVEVFGVECSIMARDLSWEWIGDAHEKFSVGDIVLVRILSVRCTDPENISIKADMKSVSQNTSHDNLKKIRVQSKYSGRVTDIHKGVVYVRLSNGVNAVAHSCFDHRTPGKKDDVGFVVTKLDEERGVAVGIITRIIKQNL